MSGRSDVPVEPARPAETHVQLMHMQRTTAGAVAPGASYVVGGQAQLVRSDEYLRGSASITCRECGGAFTVYRQPSLVRAIETSRLRMRRAVICVCVLVATAMVWSVGLFLAENALYTAAYPNPLMMISGLAGAMALSTLLALPFCKVPEFAIKKIDDGKEYGYHYAKRVKGS